MSSIGLSYTQLKAIISAKNLVYQYFESSVDYDIFASEGNIVWEARVLKDSGADQTDFETNFKAGANAKLYLPIKTEGPASPGTAASVSQLTGGVYNSTPLTLTNTQQAALQVDSSGYLKIDTSSWFGSTAPTIGQKTMANSLPFVLASDQSDVPVNIDKVAGVAAAALNSFGVNSLNTAPVELWSAYTDKGQMFTSSAVAFNLASSATENPAMLISNPNGSGKTMYVYDISLNQVTKNHGIIFSVFADPTTSANGTALTITNCKIGNGTASVINTYSGPTVSANGGVLISEAVGSALYGSMVYISNFTIIIPPNHKVLITGNPDANNIVSTISFRWAEI